MQAAPADHKALPDPNNEAEALGLVILLGLVFLFIFYLLSLRKTMKAIRPENRTITPGMVWILLVPYFQIILQFWITKAMADSLVKEYRARGLETKNEDFGLKSGFGMAILEIVLLTLEVIYGEKAPHDIMVAQGIFGIAIIVYFIKHWYHISRYGKALRTTALLQPEEIDDFDEEYDR
jgi:cell division protein FtsW (lipid II flippase)